MKTFFSATLTKMRKEAGFPTSYRFYHDNGGAPVLKVTYGKYLATEQGKILPTFGRLSRIIFGLRLVANSAPANALIAAWLRTMAGEEAYKGLLEPMLDKKCIAGLSPLHKAIKRSLSEKKFFITRERAEAIYADRVNYTCFMALSNDTGKWQPEDLAGKLSLNVADVRKALRDMEAVALVKRHRDGAYTCPLVAAHIEFPTLTSAELCERSKKRITELAKTGKDIYFRRGVLRADAQDLRNFLPMMDLNMSTSLTYSISEKTDHSALFLIEGRVTKLLDF